VANLKSISHRCHPILVVFAWELTKETIHLPLGCLQGGTSTRAASTLARRLSKYWRKLRSHSMLGSSTSAHSAMSLMAAGSLPLAGTTGCHTPRPSRSAAQMGLEVAFSWASVDNFRWHDASRRRGWTNQAASSSSSLHSLQVLEGP